MIWVGWEREYFYRGDWTGGITLIRFNKIAWLYERESRHSQGYQPPRRVKLFQQLTTGSGLGAKPGYTSEARSALYFRSAGHGRPAVGIEVAGQRADETGEASHFRAASGSLMRNIAPRPARFSAVSWPPWASTMVRAMDKPIPMPSSLVEKNGSKISLSLSSGIPGPVSETDTSANLSTRALITVSLR